MKMNYLIRLKNLYEKIPTEFEKNIFYFLCLNYQKFINGEKSTKYCLKNDIIEFLINKGLMKMSIDKDNNKEKLPDDRAVRSAIHRLMKNGFPILSSSTITGYYICDTQNEIIKSYNENHKRALKLLAMQKSFDKIAGFVSGQLEITEIIFNEEDDNFDTNS